MWATVDEGPVRLESKATSQEQGRGKAAIGLGENRLGRIRFFRFSASLPYSLGRMASSLQDFEEELEALL